MKRGKPLVIAALLILASEADAGVIRGRLRLGAPAETKAPGAVVEAAGVQQAVLWVDPLPEDVARHYRPGPGSKRVIQSNRIFAPLVTPVTVGSTIEFANRDKVYHNVFSVSPAQRFDLGKYPPRSTQSVTFEHPGVVNLFCDIHPWMSAYVIVVPHRVFAVPTRTGEFKLPKLPPGQYTLHLWHPSFGERLREVEVPKRGDLVLALSN
jgi:plastocyanin